jgi:hypothetical protein
VKQQAVSSGYWELTLLNVEMNGTALFFQCASKIFAAANSRRKNRRQSN